MGQARRPVKQATVREGQVAWVAWPGAAGAAQACQASLSPAVQQVGPSKTWLSSC